ncbi:MAG: zinc metallopeptidase [Clostridia bacterium]|nr:zinc metallopeptidase [Clostridia bacterium]
MENIAKDILNYLNNEHTKVERKEGFMGNYYSHLIDTIYIAEDFENSKMPEGANNMNKKVAELITVCHECIHSVQNKYLHILNTIFSNASMVLALICIFIGIFWISPLWLKIGTCMSLTVSIVVRLRLEVGAVNGSIKLSQDVVSKDMVEDVSEQDIQESVRYINTHKYLALLQMVVDKIIFLVLVLIIK